MTAKLNQSQIKAREMRGLAIVNRNSRQVARIDKVGSENWSMVSMLLV